MYIHIHRKLRTNNLTCEVHTSHAVTVWAHLAWRDSQGEGLVESRVAARVAYRLPHSKNKDQSSSNRPAMAVSRRGTAPPPHPTPPPRDVNRPSTPPLPPHTNQPTNQPTNHHQPKSPQRLVTAACSAPSRQRARETGERERENGATEQPPPQYTPARRSRNPTAGFIPQQRPRSNHDD